MNNVARVLITTECNLKCSYCCNKIKEVQDSFKMTTMDQFVENANKYTDINISGGEPLLAQDKLRNLINLLYIKTYANIWLYSNGLPSIDDVTIESLRRCNGINIGCHDNFGILKYKVLFLRYAVGYEKIRLQIEDVKYSDEIKDFCTKNNINVKLWKRNDCFATEEDRFII